jgi:hypothetical protein
MGLAKKGLVFYGMVVGALLFHAIVVRPVATKYNVPLLSSI